MKVVDVHKGVLCFSFLPIADTKFTIVSSQHESIRFEVQNHQVVKLKPGWS